MSKAMPKISVIVPNYNHERFLRQRVDTILAQTFQDFELILLDDCSTDNSCSILSEYRSDPRVRLEFNKVNSGSPFKQWNKGVRIGRGEYVWIAESDDYAGEGLLERLVAALDAAPEVAYAYCLSWGVNAENQTDGFADRYLRHLSVDRWRSDFVVDGREECRSYFIRTNVVPNASAVVFRKATYEQVGGADENYRICGDWKLWAAMALTGKVAYFGEPLNYFRFHDASVRNRSTYEGRDVMEYLRVIRWLLSQVTPSAEVLEAMCTGEARRWVPAIMSMHVPLRLKLTILQNVFAVDPHPLRRMIRPALETVQLKFSRHLPFARQNATGAESPGVGSPNDR
jgi:glycosyltransferase involved in cell wall biosynthesis